jgi:hypothetical protein
MTLLVTYYFNNCFTAYFTTQAVCDKSYDLWRQEEEVVDDITAVVVFFKH